MTWVVVFMSPIILGAGWLIYEAAKGYARMVSHIHPPPPAKPRRRPF